MIVSNGHGEDAIGTAIGRALTALGWEVVALPLVGQGRAYAQAGFPVLGPRREMPSGGFVHLNLRVFLKDLKAGWFAMSRAQYRALHEAARTASATLIVGDLIVGDVYALWVGTRFGKPPFYHVQPLVSVYYQEGLKPWQELHRVSVNGFIWPERKLMRRARRVYPRDAATETHLHRLGIHHARYLGNPMMDAVEGRAPVDAPEPYLLLLPGSRKDAYFSLPLMLEAALHLPLTPVIAWAGLPLSGLALPDWRVRPTPNPCGVTHVLTHTSGRKAYLTQGAFRTLLELQSRLAFATAGTAAEQAAGYGIPLIAFPTPGPQYTPGFARAQQRLLGEALTLVPPDPKALAEAARALLEHPDRYRRAQAAGRERMGPPGGAQRIAEDLSTTVG
ncbi:Conserved hypothetical protein CHP03492 [Marinithermus hydrothermalis DSM 14884]|uniref:Lipid-A-disaccharide synthase n=1 Tax=Marinithermus hydrothermalis (strain DSM 14884 / JCM 11576 / T1) TaxID=869210 RepID=F2NMU0_MARHT|nr:Conserved hypothetical protein CHP03492 [Marinithermus hydrothermalis DSM 14884]